MELHGRNDMKPTQSLQTLQHPVPNLMLVPQPTLKLNNPALTLTCVPELTVCFPSPNLPPLPGRWREPKPFLGPALSAQTMSFLHLLDCCKENASEKNPDLQAGTLDAQELRKSLGWGALLPG